MESGWARRASGNHGAVARLVAVPLMASTRPSRPRGEPVAPLGGSIDIRPISHAHDRDWSCCVFAVQIGRISLARESRDARTARSRTVWQYTRYGFGSAVLRRLWGAVPAERAVLGMAAPWWDVWLDHFPDSPHMCDGVHALLLIESLGHRGYAGITNPGARALSRAGCRVTMSHNWSQRHYRDNYSETNFRDSPTWVNRPGPHWRRDCLECGLFRDNRY